MKKEIKQKVTARIFSILVGLVCFISVWFVYHVAKILPEAEGKDPLPGVFVIGGAPMFFLTLLGFYMIFGKGIPPEDLPKMKKLTSLASKIIFKIKKIVSKLISFFLGRSVVTTYKTCYEISCETGWRPKDIVSQFLEAKAREYIFGWILKTEKLEEKSFKYTIEYWPVVD